MAMNASESPPPGLTCAALVFTGKLNDVVTVMQEITGSAVKLREMVSSVNAASQEQARGIAQISEGLSRMEKVTQRTAASANEGSTASRQMDLQARALQQIVDELKQLVDDSAEGATATSSSNFEAAYV